VRFFSVDILLKDGQGNVVGNLTSAFTYSDQGLPVVASVNPRESSVLGEMIFCFFSEQPALIYVGVTCWWSMIG